VLKHGQAKHEVCDLDCAEKDRRAFSDCRKLEDGRDIDIGLLAFNTLGKCGYFAGGGGSPIAAVALILSLSVMVSCYQLEVRALQIAIAAIAVLIAQFVWLRRARSRAS
jgi:hypothetical protein